MPFKRISIVGSASGSGKTTLARTLAERIGGTFVELDALLHGPNWVDATDDELRVKLAPIVAGDSWVIDNLAEKKVGPLILDRVELIVWLDLPPWVWFPRLVRRSGRRWWFREELWNGNRETLYGILLERDSVFRHAFRAYFQRRSSLAARLHAHALRGKRVIRLCTVEEVSDFQETLQTERAMCSAT